MHETSKRSLPPGTLLRGFRARWKAGERHLERSRGNSVAGGRREETPGTLLREYRARWKAGRDTWYTFAGIPCQVDGREETPGTLSREFRGRWTARRDTWYTFAGKPCQVEGGERHLERFCRDSVPGGRRGKTPGTLSREFRARWTAGKDTWNDKVRLEVNMRFKCAYWNIISSYG